MSMRKRDELGSLYVSNYDASPSAGPEAMPRPNTVLLKIPAMMNMRGMQHAHFKTGISNSNGKGKLPGVHSKTIRGKGSQPLPPHPTGNLAHSVTIKGSMRDSLHLHGSVTKIGSPAVHSSENSSKEKRGIGYTNSYVGDSSQEPSHAPASIPSMTEDSSWTLRPVHVQSHVSSNSPWRSDKPTAPNLPSDASSALSSYSLEDEKKIEDDEQSEHNIVIGSNTQSPPEFLFMPTGNAENIDLAMPSVSILDNPTKVPAVAPVLLSTSGPLSSEVASVSTTLYPEAVVAPTETEALCISTTTAFVSQSNKFATEILRPPLSIHPLHETKTPLPTDSDSKTKATFLPFVNNDEKADNIVINDETLAADSSSPPPLFELNLWTARLLLLLVAAVWGTNFASVKYLEGLCFHPPCNHPPSEAAFARFGIAALVSWPLLVNQPLNVILAGLECGTTITIGYVAQAMALTTIESGKCAFICSLTVVFVPVVAAIMYGKPIKASTMVAAAVALTGVGVLEGMIDVKELLGMSQAVALESNESLQSTTANLQAISASAAVAASSSTMETAALPLAGPLETFARTIGVSKGDLIALGQPLGFGYTFLRIEHYQEQFKNVPNRVLTIAAAQCVSVGVLSFFWVLYDYHGTIPNFGYMIEPHRVATLLWTGIVTTVAAIFLEGIALQKASATDASIAFSSEPVWASLFGFLLLKEQLGFESYAGGAIIMLACIIGAAADLKEQEDNRLRIES
ncbi:hypothetical protein MPSEU_000342000 [Mayamaea pseudoterrestris]|nr:hypothetical protein MPSEU_000342000 [Mayamaea pseudoterrestris]